MIVKKKPICGYSNRIAMILMLVSHGNRCQYISSETFTFGTFKKPTCVQISRHKSFGQTPKKTDCVHTKLLLHFEHVSEVELFRK